MSEELQYCKILKTNINVTDMEKTLDYITRHLEKLKGNYICVSNVHTTVMAYRNEAYRRVQNSAAMALPDGQPLAIVSRRRGHRDAQRVPGPDLMPRVMQLSEEKGYTHYFYGSSAQTLELLQRKLKAAYPKLKIAGAYSPPFRPLTAEEDEAAVNKINAAKPDFVWVALGAPKQENWMYEHRGRVNGLMIGVGAAFDFIAGTAKRAPMWMQRLCLEWVYRIMQDPGRMIPRYFDTNFAFLWHVHRESRQIRKVKARREKEQAAQRPANTADEKDRLKIAMIGHKRIPSREGGVEIVVEELAVRLTARGHKVEAYNRYGHHTSGKKYDDEYGKRGRRYYKGVRVRLVPTFRSSKLNAIVYSFFATVRALFGGYDVYHYHAEGPCAMLWLPKLFGRHVVATIHGLDWQRAKWGNFASFVLKFGEKMAAGHADEVIVLSRNVQQYFRETYGRETVFIPNGISRPAPRAAELIKEKYGLERHGYLLFLARIVPEKGVHYLIEAFRQTDTDKKLVIAGGHGQVMEYLEQIREMAAKDDRIIMTDFVQGRMLEELYSNAYLYILPSDVEGMALSLLEAMSYGNCCLVSNICENTEVVDTYGYTFEKGNAVDLKRKLDYLLEHPQEVQECRERSADYICGKYNWDDVVERTLQVYRLACGGQKKRKGIRHENIDGQ